MNSKEIQTQEDFQNLINQIAQYNSKDSSYTKTPDSITELVVKLLDLYNVSSFADFSAGRSSIALEVFKQISHQPYYYAEEINTTEYLISKLLMIVNEIREYEWLFSSIQTSIPILSGHRSYSIRPAFLSYPARGRHLIHVI